MKNIFKPIGRFLIMNLPTILSIAGATGLVATAVLAAKETPDAMEIFEEWHKADEDGKTSVKTVYESARCYAPAIIVGAASIGCIILANGMHLKRYLSVCSLYNDMAAQYTAFKAATFEQLGEDSASAVIGAIASANKEEDISEPETCEKPKPIVEVDKDGEAIKWFFDIHSGQWYRSTFKKVYEASMHLNDSYMIYGFAALKEYYHELGIEKDNLNPEFGWNCDRLLYEDQCSFIPFEYGEIFFEDGSKGISVWFPIEPCFDYDYDAMIR